jgi:hypothetical protein
MNVSELKRVVGGRTGIRATSFHGSGHLDGRISRVPSDRECGAVRSAAGTPERASGWYGKTPEFRIYAILEMDGVL